MDIHLSSIDILLLHAVRQYRTSQNGRSTGLTLSRVFRKPSLIW